MKLTPELKNVLEISEKVDESSPTKTNTKYPKWEYYNIQFKLDNQTFEGLVNIGIDSNNNKHLYEVNNIKKTSGISETSPNRPTGFVKIIYHKLTQMSNLIHHLLNILCNKV